MAKYLLDNGVYTTFRYWPLHKVEFFKPYVTKALPNSEYISKHTLNLPLHQSLSNEEIQTIITLIKDFR
ncbi:DegT/DnrJ/EryC1/StrS family aminotransferase [Sulfurimonas sp. MAG313]|nr:DegT/DnrJ/EryC1/StrS family aminotransferase [Sulfurimonas sp. MAG313]MDF1882121.1 DegT/DnrJ/EryC1/StrS family aminotransferase [Sulfurimonas sp. MAG313]